MSEFINWSSQPLSEWTNKYAKGTIVELDGHQTHYIDKGQGEPLILLHGFMYDSFLWQANIDALAKQYRVLAIDLWGCGYSTRELLDFGYPLYAKQLKLFMAHLGIEKAHMAGQSMGGGTIVQFALDNPDKVGKLILVNCAGIPNPQPFIAKFFNFPFIGEFFMKLKVNAVRYDSIRDFFVYNQDLITDEYLEQVFLPHKIKGSIEVGLKIQRADFFDKLESQITELGKLGKEILIVWGKQDKPVSVEKGERMHQLLTGSRFEVLDKAGHVSNYDQAAQFNQLTLEFLAD